ncbi:MAG: TlpA disulfide reductase family protein [Ginsengibacter sp.]
MKKFLFFSIIVFLAHNGFAQSDTSQPLYLRFPAIPQFTIKTATGDTAFSRESLHKNKPVVLILFSPDCEHCQHETTELLANIQKFKRAQIVMITYQPYEAMVKFYQEYNIVNYPQITMGRDTKFFFPIFYRVRNMPSIFVYDKKGKFKKAFEGSVGIDKIADEL